MREILCVCVWMCSLNINNAYFSSNLSLQNQVGKETHNQSEQQILLACTLRMRWRLFFFLIVFITLLFICYFGCGRGYLWRQWFLKEKKEDISLKQFVMEACWCLHSVPPVLSALGSLLAQHQCVCSFPLYYIPQPPPVQSSLCLRGNVSQTIGIWSNLGDWCVPPLNSDILKIEVIRQNSDINTVESKQDVSRIRDKYLLLKPSLDSSMPYLGVMLHLLSREN